MVNGSYWKMKYFIRQEEISLVTLCGKPRKVLFDDIHSVFILFAENIEFHGYQMLMVHEVNFVFSGNAKKEFQFPRNQHVCVRCILI